MKKKLYIICLFTLILAACVHKPSWLSTEKSRQSVPLSLIAKMRSLNMEQKAPILIRIFKKENALEIWKQTKNGSFGLLTSYNICAWSGKLGPKYMALDRQSPEGFYEITTKNMEALSHYYLAINLGFPNEFDRENGHSGNHLMIHGGCSSSGCYAMTDRNIAQIYALVRDAFLGGQNYIQIQAYPFRMTARNMALYRNDDNYEFWQSLKKGNDIFELTKYPVAHKIEARKYVFPVGDSLAKNYDKFMKAYDKEYQYYVTHVPANYKAKNPKLRGIKGPLEAETTAQWMKKAIRTGIESKAEPLL